MAIRLTRSGLAAIAIAVCCPSLAQPAGAPKDQPDACPTRLRIDDVTPTTEALDPALRGIRTYRAPYISGEATEIEKWPGFVSLRFVVPEGKKFDDGEKTADILYWCGGVLIARDWVMTAAHCVFESENAPAGPRVAFDPATGAWASTDRLEAFGLPKGSRLEIVEKTGDLTKIDARPLRPAAAASAVIVHPAYFRPRRYENDIALIKLDPATPAQGYVAKISGSRAVDPDAIKGRAMLGAGFGLTDLADPTQRSTARSERVDAADARYAAFSGRDGRTGYAGTPFLQESLVRKLDDAACKAHLLRDTPGAPWRNSQLCAIGVAQTQALAPRNAPDSCNTDSGGPLMQIDAKGCPIVSGIVSFGPDVCGRTAQPGIYTRVSSYVPWIRQATGGAKIWAVTDPAEIPPAGAVYSLLAGETDLPGDPNLTIRRMPDGPERIGDVVRVDIGVGPTPGQLTVMQRLSGGKLAYLLPRKLFDAPVPDIGPRPVAANGVISLPDELQQGFLTEEPPGPRSIFAFLYPTPALHEALKLEMRSRPRRLIASPAIRDEILRRLKAYRGLSLAQTRYQVSAP